MSTCAHVKIWTTVRIVCIASLIGCGIEHESMDGVEPPGTSDAAAATTEPARPKSVSQDIVEIEKRMNAEPNETAAEAPAEKSADEETRKSPIKIVPTRPMFQNDSEEERYVQDEEPYPMDEQFPPEDRPRERENRTREGPQITEFHLNHLHEQQSLYIVRDLMPVPGTLIDRYYKGRTLYEVWEWRSYSEEKGETLVRIRFIDDYASYIAINPGEYVLTR